MLQMSFHPFTASPATQISLARDIAHYAHDGQTDKSGRPYIEHVSRVAEIVSRSHPLSEAAAWLHDVIEDTDWTMADLQAFDIFDYELLTAVSHLTRKNSSQTYADYIDGIRTSGSSIALAVKLADLSDHLTTMCPEAEHLRARYLDAWKTLTGSEWESR